MIKEASDRPRSTGCGTGALSASTNHWSVEAATSAVPERTEPGDVGGEVVDAVELVYEVVDIVVGGDEDERVEVVLVQLVLERRPGRPGHEERGCGNEGAIESALPRCFPATPPVRRPPHLNSCPCRAARF